MKLKPILLSGALALFSTTLVLAQNDNNSKVSIGARLGLTVPGIVGGGSNPLSGNYSEAERFGAGVFAEFKISKLFSIQPMLEYAQEGARRNGFQAFTGNQLLTGVQGGIAPGIAQNLPSTLAPYAPMITDAVNSAVGTAITNAVPKDQYGNQLLYADFNSAARMNYLMLPVLAKFGWDFGHQKQWRFYVDAGPYVALLVNAHQIVTNGDRTLGTIYTGNSTSTPSVADVIGGAVTGLAQNPAVGQLLQAYPDIAESLGQMPSQLASQPSSLNSTTNIKSQLHTFNWGLEGNLGFQYQIHRNKIFIEGGGNYGLMNIQKPTSKNPDLYANGKNHLGAGTVMIGYAYAL